MKKNLIIIILSNLVTIILVCLFFVITFAGTSKQAKTANSRLFTQALNYYSREMKEKEKGIGETAKYLAEARMIKNREYEAENLPAGKNYDELLDACLNKLETSGYTKTELMPVGNYEYVTGFKIENDDLALILTDKNIYVKNGAKWMYVSLKGLNRSLYFTSGGFFYYGNEPYLIVGTSYSGIFYKKLKDKYLREFNAGAAGQFATDSKLEFYETVSAVHADKQNIFVGYMFSKGIGRIGIEDLLRGKNPHFKKTDIGLSNDVTENIESFSSNDGALYADSNYAVYRYNGDSQAWSRVSEKSPGSIMKKSHTIGIYLNPYAVSTKKKIDEYIALAKEFSINAFVIDFKDDRGRLTYPSDIEFAKKIGAVKKIVDLDYLVEKCREAKIKIIARLVSFKDPFAFDYNKNELAIWDWKNDKPWEGPKEDKWIDPFSDVYRKYLIDVGKELESKGVSEIQYDYVRFPSDGEIYNIQFRHRKDGYSRNFILYKFFTEAKKEINVPVSADFYGYNCWYFISANVAQDISLMSRSLDVVYPMFYPSHFVDGFYQKGLKQYERNFDLYYHGVLRTYENSGYRIEVRPWIQTFNIKVDIPLKDYIRAQIEGLKKAGIDSYIFWSASSNYKMLDDVFAKK